jgi:uncharacterized protein
VSTRHVSSRPPPEAHEQREAVSIAVERTAYRHRLEVFLASHDAGETLTADALGCGETPQDLARSAAAVADYADAAIEIIDDEHRPRLECREGCAFCCRKPGVLVTVPELVRILDYVGGSSSAEDRVGLEARARRYAAQVEGRSFNDPTPESVPCPLLVNERCTVYEVRPLVCRGYNSTSVAACRKAHDDPASMVPMFAVLKDVTDGATVGAAHALKAAGMGDAMVDLGTALHIALSAGDGAVDAVLSKDVLRPAEHRTWVAQLWNGVRETARDVGVPVKRVETKP